MPILIPNRKLVRPTISFKPLPGTAKTALKNPAPIGVSTTGAAGSGSALLQPTNSRANYVGYSVKSNTGGATDDEAYSVVRNTIVEGFTGVSPGVPVFIDPTARPDPENDFSGLTQTQGAQALADAIGVGWTTTKVLLY